MYILGAFGLIKILKVTICLRCWRFRHQCSRENSFWRFSRKSEAFASEEIFYRKLFSEANTSDFLAGCGLYELNKWQNWSCHNKYIYSMVNKQFEQCRYITYTGIVRRFILFGMTYMSIITSARYWLMTSICSDPVGIVDWGSVLFTSLRIWHLWAAQSSDQGA